MCAGIGAASPYGWSPCPKAGHYSPRCPCVRSQLTCYRAYVAAGEIVFRVAGCLSEVPGSFPVRTFPGLGVTVGPLLLSLTTLEPSAITGRAGELAAPLT